MTLTVRRRLDVLAWVLVTGVFALDLLLPERASVGLLYVVVLLLGLWTPGSRDVLFVAGFASVLSVVEYMVSPVDDHWTVNLSNHLLQVIVLWVTAIGVHRHRRTLLERELAERHAQAAEAQLREQAALAQLGQMAAVVAHEVRNPLAGIRGAVQILAKRLGPDAAERNITSEVIRRIDALAAIVQDLLQFARPRRPVPVQRPFSGLARPTLDLLRDDPALARMALELAGEDAVVFADPELFNLVLQNLLMNSVDAMERRGRIVVTATDGPDACEIRVADEGPGIPPAARARLFEPFYTTKHRGTGLGLATARRLVEAHGGTLNLVWPATGGTTAVLRLPHPDAATARARITPS